MGRFLRHSVGVAMIFSGGGGRLHFLLDQKSDDLFLVITLSYMVIYVVYCHSHQLPFYLIRRGARHQIQPHLCLIPTKMPRKSQLNLTIQKSVNCGDEHMFISGEYYTMLHKLHST